MVESILLLLTDRILIFAINYQGATLKEAINLPETPFGCITKNTNIILQDSTPGTVIVNGPVEKGLALFIKNHIIP
jgi:hypothetical protein